MIRPSRAAWLALLCGVQVLLLAFLIAYFASVQDQVRMELEARPPGEAPQPHLAARDVLDTVSLFSGPEFLGHDFATEFRRGLSFEAGQFMWFLLQRTLGREAPLVRLASASVPSEKERARLRDGLTDGALSFFYDVGARRELAVSNWNSVGVAELQASPLLPWTKRLDFVALSSLADSAVGGLGFVTELNQGILLLVPPHDPARLRRLGLFARKPNLVELAPGLHPLAEGLWALVLPAPAGSGHPAELDLLVERADGSLALFAGSGLNRPLVALREATRQMGRPVALYVGSTGYAVGWDTRGIEDEILALQQEFPQVVLIPNGDTSVFAHGALEALLGPRYRPGRLGTRLRL